jgi:prepilin-type processing-associated H-X9-DG protein
VWCPEDPNPVKAGPWANISYGYNHGPLGGLEHYVGGTNPQWYWTTPIDPWGKKLGKPARMESIARPSQTVLLLDSKIGTDNVNPIGWFVAYAHPDQNNGVAFTRHGITGCNVLWIDGHANLVVAKKTSVEDGSYWRALYEDPELLGDIREEDVPNRWDRD